MPEHPPATKDPMYVSRFDDYFANRKDPVGEKYAIFCQGNRLETRFINAERFVIAELGFGIGLAFLNCVKLWQKQSPENAWLDFISIERYPLSIDDLQQALSQFPALSPHTEQLTAQFPANISGFHRIAFPQWQVRLTLCIGDALPMLESLETKVDAWFPDGFSPQKNPQMWQPAIYRQMARLSHANTTLSTYTAASQVRRDLIEAGFEMRKQPGFAGKRDHLVGQFNRLRNLQRKSTLPTWYFPAKNQATGKRVLVVGAGVAGCASANRLAASGYRVTLVDQDEAIAGAASANPAALFKPYFTRDNNLASRFSRQGFLYSLQHLEQLKNQEIHSSFQKTGLLVLAKDESEAAKFNEISVSLDPGRQLLELICDPELIRELSGSDCVSSTCALYLRHSGWLDIQQYCIALIKEFSQRIEFIPNRRASDFQSTRDGIKVTLANQAEKPIFYQNVILASGHSIQDGKTAYLKSIPNRGQISTYPVDHDLKCPINHYGYVIPTQNALIAGSSYAIGNDNTALRSQDHLANRDNLEKCLNVATFKKMQQQPEGGWAGVRITSQDRLPAVGEVCDAEVFTEYFGAAIRGAKIPVGSSPATIPGLYVCASFGSRALSSALLSAEIIASLIDNRPLPVPAELFAAVHPARFLVRNLRKKSYGE